MKHYTLGKIIEDLDALRVIGVRAFGLESRFVNPFRLSDEELNTHLLVLGTTGSGKSRLFWQLLREHRRNRRGFCLIDPGDLAEDFLADCGREMLDTGNKSLLQKIHWVELSPFQLARYDPFRFSYPKKIHPELWDVVCRSYQYTKAQSVSEIFQWKQGQSTDFEGMPRLQRLLHDVFIGVSTEVDHQRLTLGDAKKLLDLGDPEHDRIFNRLKTRLPREVVADFEVIHRFTSVRDLRTETESTLNRLRSTLGPLMEQTLSGNGRDPALDLFEIIQRGDYLLVKVARTPFASNDQNNALAGLFIHDIFETMLITPREKRRPFTLMIDEAHKYLRPGIGEMARTARKYQLGLVLASTDLASMRKGDVDLAPELLSVFNTVCAFRLTWPEDLKAMAEFLYSQNIDFTELVQEVERRAGPQWIPVDEWSETVTRQTSRSETHNVTATQTESSQQTRAQSSVTNRSTGYGPDGLLNGTTSGAGKADSIASSASTSIATGSQDGTTVGDSEGYGITINHKLVHIEKIIREAQKTGLLTQAVADQLARFAQAISGKSRRHASVRVRERPAVEIEAADVQDPFASPEAQARAVEWIKWELFQVHDYYFVPTADPAEDARRIREFLGEEPVQAAVDHEIAPHVIVSQNGRNGHTKRVRANPVAVPRTIQAAENPMA